MNKAELIEILTEGFMTNPNRCWNKEVYSIIEAMEIYRKEIKDHIEALADIILLKIKEQNDS